jgi:outer membrane PBP1 activator LpoA protein
LVSKETVDVEMDEVSEYTDETVYDKQDMEKAKREAEAAKQLAEEVTKQAEEKKSLLEVELIKAKKEAELLKKEKLKFRRDEMKRNRYLLAEAAAMKATMKQFPSSPKVRSFDNVEAVTDDAKGNYAKWTKFNDGDDDY